MVMSGAAGSWARSLSFPFCALLRTVKVLKDGQLLAIKSPAKGCPPHRLRCNSSRPVDQFCALHPTLAFPIRRGCNGRVRNVVHNKCGDVSFSAPEFVVSGQPLWLRPNRQYVA